MDITSFNTPVEVDRRQLLDLLAQATDAIVQVDLLNVLAANLRHQDLDRAWAINREVEDRARSGTLANRPYFRGLAECFYWRGKFHSIHKHYRLALECFVTAMEWCTESEQHEPPPDQMIAALYDDSPDHFLVTRLNTTALHNILGVTLALVAECDGALHHYLQAWQGAMLAQDDWMLALLCNNIAYLYRVLDQAADAEPYIQRGLRLVPTAPTRAAEIRLRATMLNNACWIAATQSAYDQAITYGHESLRLYDGLGWAQGQAEILHELGRVYQHMGRLQVALECCDRAYAIARRSDLGEDMVLALLYSGQILSHLHDPSALDRLTQALDLAIARDNRAQAFACHEALAAQYEVLGDLTQALHHYKHFHVLKEAVFNDRSVRLLSVLRVRHQVEQAQQEIRWHQRHTQELEAEIAQRTQVQTELEYLATIDGLTGLANRRHFIHMAELMLAEARAQGAPIAVVLFDIDRFKAINDTYGHAVGDQTLRAVAQTAAESIRDNDLIGRYGGEEFALLFPGAVVSEAWVIAERLRQAIAQRLYPIGDTAVSITVSLGIASSSAGAETLEALLQMADQALYCAKANGRNQSHHAEGPVA